MNAGGNVVSYTGYFYRGSTAGLFQSRGRELRYGYAEYGQKVATTATYTVVAVSVYEVRFSVRLYRLSISLCAFILVYLPITCPPTQLSLCIHVNIYVCLKCYFCHFLHIEPRMWNSLITTLLTKINTNICVIYINNISTNKNFYASQSSHTSHIAQPGNCLYSDRNVPQCHVTLQNSHVYWPAIEFGPPQWQVRQ
jgi:hypothetical protein